MTTNEDPKPGDTIDPQATTPSDTGSAVGSTNDAFVNLLDLAVACLAASMAASEPIRRIALGSLASPTRTPIPTADESEIIAGLNGLAPPSSLVIAEEVDGPKSSGEHMEESEIFTDKPESARSLGDVSFSSNNNNISGRIVPSRQSSMTSIASRSKADGTLVTDADGAAQRLIVHAIRSVDTRVTIVGEESAEEENRLILEDDQPSSDNSTSALESLADQAIASATVTSMVPPAPSGDLLPLHQWESCWRFAQGEVYRHDVSADFANIEINVDPSRISVFVDPLDGTKNYARGQFDSVSTLVAIIVDNTPCFGVICKPFGQDTSSINDEGESCDADITAAAAALATVSLSEAAAVAAASEPSPLTFPPSARGKRKTASTPNCSYAVFGGTLLQGVFVAGQDEAVSSIFAQRSTGHSTPPDNGKEGSLPRAIISSSRSGGIVKRICNALHEVGVLGPDMVLVSGAGEKALRLVVGVQREGLWPFPRPGTSLWDVAAADALLIQLGGRLTDSLGRPMNYSAAAFEGGSTDNDSGIFASNSTELHESCLKVFQSIQEEDAREDHLHS